MKHFKLIDSETMKALANVNSMMAMLSKNMQFEIQLAHNLTRSFPTKEFIEALEKQTRALSAIKMQMPDFSRLSSAADAMRQGMLCAHKTMSEAEIVLLELGWWIYPDWTIPALKNIIDAHKAGKDKEIEESIVDYFDKNVLNEMLKRWKTNNKFSTRIQVLEDAIWAHEMGKYTLSVPALLPQIEGIINENSGKKGKITHTECVKILKDYRDKKVKLKPTSFFYPLAALMFAENLLKEAFEWGKPSRKGRSPILHGHNVGYDDKVFSLKLILLIDFLQNLL